MDRLSLRKAWQTIIAAMMASNGCQIHMDDPYTVLPWDMWGDTDL